MATMAAIGALVLMLSPPPEADAVEPLPTASAGGTYVIAEGASLALSATASTDPDAGSPTYAWDLDGDGDHDDATGRTPHLAWDALVALGLDDDGGPFAISVEVSDGVNTATDSASLTITNTAPTVSLTGPVTSGAGRPYRLRIDVADLGHDTVTGWVINWGDGTIDTGTGVPGSREHTYTTAGLHHGVQVQVTDEDGTWQSADIVTAHFDTTERLRRYDSSSGATVADFAGTGSALTTPYGLTIGPDGLLYASGLGSHNIVRFDPADQAFVDAFIPHGQGGLANPTGLAFGPDGNLYVASAGTGQVLRFDGHTGAFIDVFVDSGTLSEPTGLLFTADGTLLVADGVDDDIERYDGLTGTHLGRFASTGIGNRPTNMTLGPGSEILVALYDGSAIGAYDASTGAALTTFTANDLETPHSLAVGPDGQLWVSDYWSERIVRFDLDTGASLGTVVSETAPAGPTGLAFVPDFIVRVGDDLVVNSSGDATDLVVGDGRCDTGQLNATGQPECTLRAALVEANADSTPSSVTFDLPAADTGHRDGQWTITPGAGLPAITAPVVLDASTQTGWIDQPIVVIDGTNVNGSGLSVSAGDSTIRGFAIHSFANDGIDLTTNGGNTVAGNWIGLLPDGTAAPMGDDGIAVRSGSNGNIIGGPGATDGNVLSANGGEGLLVESNRNMIEGNNVGTDHSGQLGRGNGHTGITIRLADRNTIDGNIIAGNGTHGIELIGADHNVVTANLIGIGADGTTPIGNTGNGIAADIGASNANRFGGVAGGDANTIGHNGGHGLSILHGSSHDNAIMGNSIIANGGSGIDLGGAGANDHLNAAVVIGAVNNDGTVTVEFDLDVPAGDYRAEIFTNPWAAAATDNPPAAEIGSTDAEGEIDQAAVMVTHPGSGVARYQATYSGFGGDVVTLTVTEIGSGAQWGSTSAFSDPVTATGSGAPADTDGDGLWDHEEDADLDGDLDPATNPGPDTDGDTTPDYLDTDDDGDQRPTAAEHADGNGDHDPRDARDTDHDGQPDYLDRPLGVTVGIVDDQQTISSLSGGLAGPLANDDRFGSGTAGVGDLDGDGINDLAVGVGNDGDGGPGRGAVYILFLNPNGTVRAEQKISSTSGGLTSPLDDNDHFGFRLAAVGDLDGDGRTELMVGAPGDDDGGADRGAVHVLFLNPNGTVRAEEKISTVIAPLSTNRANGDRFGNDVGPLGDLDGDGVNDALVSAFRTGGAERGEVHVLFLNADGSVRSVERISRSDVHHTDADPATTVDRYDGFGSGLSALGDLDGDGITDIAVGAWGVGNGGDEAAKAVHVLFLNPGGTVRSGQVISHATGGVATTAAADIRFGRAVTAPGDLDGDGNVDVIVGGQRRDGDGHLDGAVFVLLLNVDGTIKHGREISEGRGGLSSPVPDNGTFGASVTSLGDLDGDGALDLAVGASADDEGGVGRGAVRVLDLQPSTAVTVNSTGDQTDNAPGDRRCDTGGAAVDGAPACTLRAAIAEANASARVDTIEFALPVADPGHVAGSPSYWSIRPGGSPLPPITDGTSIDATTQPGWSGVPVVELDGSSLPNGANGTDGIVVSADDVTIRGLALTGWPGNGASTTTANVTVAGNWFGIRPDGTDAPNTDSELVIFGAASHTVVGGPTVADRNLFAGTGAGAALAVTGMASDTVIENNRFGFGPDGVQSTAPINDLLVVNGDTTGTIVTGNRLGHGRGAGVVHDTTGTATIRGNVFGLNANESQAPINTAIQVTGIGPVLIGGTTDSTGNTIAYTSNEGIGLHGTDTNAAILGNSISNNRGLGIDIDDDGVTGNDPGDTDTGPNRRLNFPEITSATASGGATIVEFTLDVPAGTYRIESFTNPSGPHLSGHGPGQRPEASKTISHNGTGPALFTIVHRGSDGDVVTLTATEKLGPGSYGATSEFSAAALVTPATAARVNDSGDGGDLNPGDAMCATGATNSAGDPQCTLRAAIEEINAGGSLEEIHFAIPASDAGWDGGTGTWTIRPTSPLPMIISDARIDGATQPGFTASTSTAPQALTGRPVIELDGSAAGPGDGLHIGATVEIHGLVVNRFTAAAVHFDTGADGSRITGSYLGTDTEGLVALASGNASVGVEVEAATITIGGINPADRNVIAGFNVGIEAHATAADLRIERNLIGVGADATSPVANGAGAVLLSVPSAVIDGNVVSANVRTGLRMHDSAASVTGNHIGLDATGAPAGNGGSGIAGKYARSLTIGGLADGDANIIAHNGADGISLHAGVGVAVIGNSIFDNGDLAIDWGDDGPSANDPGETDGVPNLPTITSLNLVGPTATATFDLLRPAGDYRIEFYRVDQADPSGFGELQTLVAATTVTHTGGTAESFQHGFPATAGELISATATLQTGTPSGFDATSEAAVAVAVNRGPTLDNDHAVVASAEGETASLDNPAVDVDGDAMTWSATGLPPGLTIDPANGHVAGTISPVAAAASPYSVTVTVDDGRGGSDVDTISWTVSDTNRAPVLAPMADIDSDEHEPMSFGAIATDPDLPADTITYSATGLPVGATLDPNTGEFTWTPTEDQGPGTYPVTITATDNGSPSLDDSRSMTITVAEINAAPVLQTIGDQRSGAESTVSVTPVATDPDRPANTLTWTATGLPPGLTLDTTSGTISGTTAPTAATGSPYTVMVSVEDGAGGSAHETFTWTVGGTNRNPSLDPIADVTVTEGATATFTAAATDPDGPADELTLSASGLPTGATFDPISGRFTWPTDENTGPTTAVVTVTVVDSGSPPLSASQTVTVTIAEDNQPPVLSLPLVTTGPEGRRITIIPTATDPDRPANTLTWSATGLPPGATIDPISGSVEWTPTEAQGPGVFDILITVCDDGTPSRCAADDGVISVAEANQPPVVVPTANQFSAEADQVSLALTATDADLPANTLRWSATGLPPGLTVDPITGMITGTIAFDAAAGSPHRTTAQVTDGRGATATTTFSWTVSNVNRPPTAVAVADQFVGEGERLSFTVSGRDPDLDPLEYTFTHAPTGAHLHPDTGEVTWTPDEAQGPGNHTVGIRVSDGVSDHELDVTIVVSEHNQPPTLAQPADQTVVAGSSFSLGLSAADPDLPANVLRYQLLRAPTGMTVDATTGLLRWRPDPAASGSAEVEVLVTDGGSPPLDAAVTFDVGIVPAKLPFDDGDAGTTEAVGDTFATLVGESAMLDVLANDAGQGLSIIAVTQPEVGTASVGNGRIVFTPPPEFTGMVTFRYRIRSSAGTTAEAAVVVHVRPPTMWLANDQVITMSGKQLLVNPTSNDGIGAVDYVIEIGAPTHGTANLEEGRIRYLPPSTFTGTDRFRYTVTDRFGTTRSAMVNVTVAEPALLATTAPLIDVDVPAAAVPVLEFGPLTVSAISDTLVDAARTLSVPVRLLVAAGAWLALLAMALAWFAPTGSVGAVTNTRRGKRAEVRDLDGGRRLFHFRHDADLIWIKGRRRRRHGSWVRRVETPMGEGLMEDERLVDMDDAYLNAGREPRNEPR